MAPPPQKEGEVATPAALRAPAHVIARVFSQLDCVDLLSCSLVCRQWYRDSEELREEWRKEYLETWNLQGLSFQRQTQPPCPTCSIRSLRTWCP
ncbi:F-box/SPRY domain-containing protein 1 [Brachypodium distachyon]|uniref:F-box domain-containing protein n=1 Tax=Brachypodium distachyon TaxID=15368 RepID=I1IPK0_BRADI|nr:F-box/SPRY domain-containing protein 1 [Brachypodium distachyon]KQJ89948.1 hypothetical protein BRADI_4g28650v3 [Brachypodium distachyon]|eukprot:XP_010238088.1 F-box/SPRY domain-containing protein 1 [Brachypodium distachyon]